MIKTIVLIISFLSLSNYLYSQNADKLLNKEDIIKCNEQIIKKYKKSNCYRKEVIPEITNVFNFSYEGEFEKEDFENKTFLNKIKPVYYKIKGKNYLKTYAIIYDNNKLIAKTENFIVYCMSDYNDIVFNYNNNLLNIINDLDIVLTFQISLSPINVFFLIDEVETVYVYILKLAEKDSEVFLLDEYVDKEWEEFSRFYNR